MSAAARPSPAADTPRKLRALAELGPVRARIVFTRFRAGAGIDAARAADSVAEVNADGSCPTVILPETGPAPSTPPVGSPASRARAIAAEHRSADVLSRALADRGRQAPVGFDVRFAVGGHLDQAGAGSERIRERSEGSRRRWAARTTKRLARGRAARRVPSSASNSSSSSASACGRNSKIPPPPLSMTTIRTGVIDVAQRGRGRRCRAAGRGRR